METYTSTLTYTEIPTDSFTSTETSTFTPTATDTATQTFTPNYTATVQAQQTVVINAMYVTQWGSQGTGNGQFKIPVGIAIDSSEYIYFADSLNNRIVKFNP